MTDTGKPSLSPALGRNVVAFGAARKLSAETRSVMAVAVEFWTDRLFEDLADVTEGRHPEAADYLPPAWRIGIDVGFMRGMLVAMASVGHGLTIKGWEGPSSTAEELCLKAILDFGSGAVTDIYQLRDPHRVREQIKELREVAFQDLDHEFLVRA